MVTIREVSQQIDSGSEQLACAAVDLAEGSTEQAGKVSDLVNLMDVLYQSMPFRLLRRARLQSMHSGKAGLFQKQWLRLRQ